MMETKRFSPSRVAVLLFLGAGAACRSCALPPSEDSAASPAPKIASASWLREAALPARDAAWTSTRDVSALALDGSGSLWVATRGGVLRRDRSGRWRKWTMHDGLPSHEARAIETSGGSVSVLFPQHRASWKATSSTWEVQPLTAAPDSAGGDGKESPAQEARAESKVTWRGQECLATLDGLQIAGKDVALPPSSGTHASALLSGKRALWAAMYGDGLWQWDGRSWKRDISSLPLEAREVTAIAGSEDDLWLGTRRAGVWHRTRGRWARHERSGDPFDANVQSLCLFRGALWASTLEDGLQARARAGWKTFGTPTLSSDAPRQLAVFRDALYVRHGSGAVDRFDGQRWVRDVMPWLPRHKALGLSSDGRTLVVSQWGGWSEWDGVRWTHRFPKAMAGLTAPSLLIEGRTLWVGTQSRGLAQWQTDKESDSPAKWHDERDGLGDDWVTALARSGSGGRSRLAAGSFVGGLSVFDGQRWSEPILDGENVTALEGDGRGGFFIATRHGTWQRDAAGSLRKVGGSRVDGEAQALLRQGKGLWIGARTGLFWIADVESEAVKRPSTPG